MIGIYKIKNPNGKQYVGQSVNIKKRFTEYKGLRNCKGQVKLYNSFVKYGIDNHIFEILCECNIEELNEKERFFQEKYKSVDEGLNLRFTKTDDKCGNMSKDSVNKMKKSNKRQNLGKIWIHKDDIEKLIKKNELEYFIKLGYELGQSEWHKQKNRDGNLGRKHSEETKIKIKMANLNKIVSENTKLKLSKLKKGKNLGNTNPNAKSVMKIDKKTLEILCIYDTGKEASKFNNVLASKISLCCNGKRKSAGGYIWAFNNKKQ